MVEEQTLEMGVKWGIWERAWPVLKSPSFPSLSLFSTCHTCSVIHVVQGLEGGNWDPFDLACIAGVIVHARQLTDHNYEQLNNKIISPSPHSY